MKILMRDGSGKIRTRNHEIGGGGRKTKTGRTYVIIIIIITAKRTGGGGGGGGFNAHGDRFYARRRRRGPAHTVYGLVNGISNETHGTGAPKTLNAHRTRRES